MDPQQQQAAQDNEAPATSAPEQTTQSSSSPTNEPSVQMPQSTAEQNANPVLAPVAAPDAVPQTPQPVPTTPEQIQDVVKKTDAVDNGSATYDGASGAAAAPTANSPGGPASVAVDNADVVNALSNDGAGGAPNSGDGAEGSGPGTGPEGKSLWQKVKDWWNGDSNTPQAESPAPEASPTQPEEPKAETPAETPGPDDKQAEPPKKKLSEMTPEEREADKAAKMEEYGKQSPEEKEARWAKSDGKLDQETWDKIKQLKDPSGKPDLAAQKQAMLQAGIEKLDYDDPRRAELEKIQTTMNGKDSRTGAKYETGSNQTGCGGTVDEMLRKGGDTKQGTFPGYVAAEKREALPTAEGQEELRNAQTQAEKDAAKDKINAVTPKSGDVYELQNPTGDPTGRGHAGTFCVASPDGKTWLTYDGGQQARTANQQEIKLVMRNVSVDSQGRTKVGAPDSPSGTDADNQGRAVSGTYDYQKMYNKYPALHPPASR